MNTECYAYQIALKTLKERCNYLQNKLESVEEEKCQLKLQISQDAIRKSPRSTYETAQLHEQIALLTEQKAQLKHQVQLVTAENHKLWSRLSRFTSTEDDFEKGSVKDNPLKCLEDDISHMEDHSDLEISKIIISPECGRESLEEISLKLNGAMMEQEAMQSEFPKVIGMKVDDNSVQMENFAFSLSDDSGSVLDSFKNHIMKLKHFKQMLQNNKNDLTSGIALLKNFQKNNLCHKCNRLSVNRADADSRTIVKVCCYEDQINDMSTLRVNDLGVAVAEEVANSDKICPLCGIVFTGSIQDFQEHVSDHFSDEITTNSLFEVV